MSSSKAILAVVRGGRSAFEDFDHADADAEQLKAVLAARIIQVLDKRKLTVRAAGDLTGMAASDVSRVRQAKLDRFTIDRLMAILAKLDQEVCIEVAVTPSKRRASVAPAGATGHLVN